MNLFFISEASLTRTQLFHSYFCGSNSHQNFPGLLYILNYRCLKVTKTCVSKFKIVKLKKHPESMTLDYSLIPVLKKFVFEFHEIILQDGCCYHLFDYLYIYNYDVELCSGVTPNLRYIYWNRKNFLIFDVYFCKFTTTKALHITWHLPLQQRCLLRNRKGLQLERFEQRGGWWSVPPTSKVSDTPQSQKGYL